MFVSWVFGSTLGVTFRRHVKQSWTSPASIRLSKQKGTLDSSETRWGIRGDEESNPVIACQLNENLIAPFKLPQKRPRTGGVTQHVVGEVLCACGSPSTVAVRAMMKRGDEDEETRRLSFWKRPIRRQPPREARVQLDVLSDLCQKTDAPT